MNIFERADNLRFEEASENKIRQKRQNFGERNPMVQPSKAFTEGWKKIASWNRNRRNDNRAHFRVSCNRVWCQAVFEVGKFQSGTRGLFGKGRKLSPLVGWQRRCRGRHPAKMWGYLATFPCLCLIITATFATSSWVMKIEPLKKNQNIIIWEKYNTSK